MIKMNLTDISNIVTTNVLYLKVILILVVAFFGIGMIKRAARKFLSSTALPLDTQLFIRKSVGYVLWFVVLLYVTAELHLGEILYPVLGASVLVGAALALAVKDALSDAVAGLFLLSDKHFNIGDEITTLNYSGEIIDVTLRKTCLKTSDGTIVILANGKIDSSGWVLNRKVTVKEVK
jgi:small-conductance mechanosensitive channel